jgi:hypothetical protein
VRAFISQVAFVIPANAGIQYSSRRHHTIPSKAHWVPAFAGTTLAA